MRMDTRRLILRATIEKVMRGEATPENVRLCIESMGSIFREVDGIRYLRRTRAASGWTEDALQRINLTNLGNYAVCVKTKQDVRTVIFTDGDTGIEFVFSKELRAIGDQLSAAVERVKHVRDRREHEAVAEALIEGALMNATDGKQRSVDDLLLGGKSLALDDYRLRCVNRVDQKNGLLGLFPIRRRKTIYVESAEG